MCEGGLIAGRAAVWRVGVPVRHAGRGSKKNELQVSCPVAPRPARARVSATHDLSEAAGPSPGRAHGGVRGAAADVNRAHVSTTSACEQVPARTSAGAPGHTEGLLTRTDLASHLQLSTRSVDRFIERHGLRTSPGRPVLVRLESYARCLVGLRHQSTSSMAPAVRPGLPAPVPLQPGEELILIAKTDDSDALQEAIRQLMPGCTIRTPDECPDGHWFSSVLVAAKAMAQVRRAMGRGTARPTHAGNPGAAQYLRRFLHEAHAYAGQPLDGPVLARALRQMPAREGRALLLEALAASAREVADSPASGAPLEYVREPLLNGDELANEVRRSVDTVRRWRVDGTGPVFLRVERAVRYSRVDLDQWLDKPRTDGGARRDREEKRRRAVAESRGAPTTHSRGCSSGVSVADASATGTAGKD